MITVDHVVLFSEITQNIFNLCEEEEKCIQNFTLAKDEKHFQDSCVRARARAREREREREREKYVTLTGWEWEVELD